MDIIIICSDEMLAMQYIPKGGTMLDIGSCYGMWIEFMLSKADKVYAFEPDRRLFPKLLERYNDNQRIGIYNIAMHNTNGVSKFQINLEGNSRLDANCSGEDVLSSTIDNFFENTPISCIKMDIEGRELEALNGGLKTILKYLPILIIETHDNRQNIVDFFKAYNYNIVFSHHRSRFPQTDNGLMVAVHETKMKELTVDVDIRNRFRIFRGDVALSMMESVV